MGKNTSLVCYLTIVFLISFSLSVHAEKQDANKPQDKADPNKEILTSEELGFKPITSTDPNHTGDFKYIVELKQEAEQGDPNAQYQLGFCCEIGIGVDKNDNLAVYWYRKAAEQGHVAAQFNLGGRYYDGQGVEKSYYQAAYWYRKVAEQGDASAQFNIGNCYYFQKDYEQAVYWFRKAAEQGLAVAQFNLGLCYEKGQGVEQDYKQAVYWYCKAAEQGDAKAQFNLGICYWKGEGVIEDYAEAYKWFLLAGMNGEDVSKPKMSLQNKLGPDEIREVQRRAKEFVKQQTANKENAKKNPSSDIIPTLKATGTAFCIHPEGFFVTAAHVVQGTNSLKIRTEKGIVPARVISSDEGLDIALLKVEGKGFTTIPLVSSSAVKTGQKVFTIGFPNIEVQGFEPKYTEGVISSLTGVQNNPRFFQISVAVQPGNSGGPLVDEKGRVIGIVNAKLDDIAALVVTGSVPQNVNYAVKSSFVLPLLENVEGLKEMPKAAELSREEAIQKAKSAVGLVLCY